MNKLPIKSHVSFIAFADPEKSLLKYEKRRGSIRAALKKFLSQKIVSDDFFEPLNLNLLKKIAKDYTIAEIAAYFLTHRLVTEPDLKLIQFITEQTDGKPEQAYTLPEKDPEDELVSQQIKDFFERRKIQLVEGEVVEDVEDNAKIV